MLEDKLFHEAIFEPNEMQLKMIEEKAYKYWEEDGKPDGEKYIDHKYWGRMKIKDVHWNAAAHNAGRDW